MRGKMKRCCSVLLLSSMMIGCSAGMADLAAEGKWQELGYRDGLKGQHQKTPSTLQQLATEAQQSVNYHDYEGGYLEGIQEYCNPDHAYQVGLSGNYYYGVCQHTPDAQRFRMEWQRGWNESTTIDTKNY